MHYSSSVPLGTLKLPMWFGRFFVVEGGPYMAKPRHKLGVKMAAEIKEHAYISIPTRDYDVPDRRSLEKGLREAVDAILKKHEVYVGCMGGKGRTGLFLAVLAKAFGVKDPVKYVRKTYYSHAVETPDQFSYVEKFKIPDDILMKISIAKCLSFTSWSKNMTKKTK